MDFGLDKCTVLHIEKDIPNYAPFTSEGPELGPEDSYKHIGISESSDILYEEIKMKKKSEYTSRVKAILK